MQTSLVILDRMNALDTVRGVRRSPAARPRSEIPSQPIVESTSRSNGISCSCRAYRFAEEPFQCADWHRISYQRGAVFLDFRAQQGPAFIVADESHRNLD